jgi:Alpha-2-macroglobulin family
MLLICSLINPGLLLIHFAYGLMVLPYCNMKFSVCQVTVFKPFFVSLNLPYSVVRGEQFQLKVTVFNYLETNVQVNSMLFVNFHPCIELPYVADLHAVDWTSLLNFICCIHSD